MSPWKALEGKGNRLSIGRVMIFIAIAIVALGVAAFREPSPIWTSILYSLALGGNLLALVAAIVGSGRTRSVAIGFAVCGWGYLFLALLQGSLVTRATPFLIPSVVVGLLLDYLAAGLPDQERHMVNLATDALFIIGAGTVGGVFAWFLSMRLPDPARPIISQRDQP